MKNLFLLFILFSLSFQTIATNYYISATGDNNNVGQSVNAPFKTFKKAADLTVAGDTVFVMNGVYNSTSNPVLNVTRSGTASSYITYKAMPGHSPKITASGNVWNAVSINGSYIVFEGFELEGNNANITYAAALASYNDRKNGGTNWSYYANFNTNALSIGGPNTESKFPHHVIIRHCKVHDFPGAGLNAIQADYVTFENNIVYNNAWYMMYGGSGISILNPFNSDNSTGYKNIIRNNICNNNKTTIPWIEIQKLSDGNGIIIDVNQYPYGGSAGVGEAYLGRTLVENNISFNNGGSGIHSYSADHVDIINNTAYHNGTIVGYPEIFSNSSQDVNIINNIMYARNGGECNSKPRNATEVYNYNIYFNGKVNKQGVNDLVADPQFVNLSTDLALANFRLQPTSPAINQGSNVAGQFSLKDILGTIRPQGAKPDRGAYESILVTAIASPFMEENVMLYPNPTKEIITIHFQNQITDAQIEIWSSNGMLMKKQLLTAQINEVNVKQLSAGLYVGVIYKNDQIVSVQQFIKQ